MREEHRQPPKMIVVLVNRSNIALLEWMCLRRWRYSGFAEEARCKLVGVSIYIGEIRGSS